MCANVFLTLTSAGIMELDSFDSFALSEACAVCLIFCDGDSERFCVMLDVLIWARCYSW